MSECVIEGCSKSRKSKVYCGMHDQRVRRYGDPNYITPESERRKSNRKSQPSLGILKVTTYPKYLGRHEHRVVMKKHLGRPLKRGDVVHHIDGNKHNNAIENLQLITQSEHIKQHRAEMIAARKKKTHCPQKHEYTPENTYITKTGSKSCRTCSRTANKKWMANKCR